MTSGLNVGDWPVWAPPPIRIFTAEPTGAAEAAWQAEMTALLRGAADEESGQPDTVVGLGLSTVIPLAERRGAATVVIVESPTDSELPLSIAARLRLMAAEGGMRLAPAPARPSRPVWEAAVAVLGALKALAPVSVIVPNYNYSRYIEDRLRQISSQTLPVAEIIVLDDASTDDSIGRIRGAFPALPAPARLVPNTRNSGSAFRQWAKGVRAARGELIWIAEADDRASPDFLAHLVPAFNDPQVVMAQAQSRQIGPEGEIRYDDYEFYLAEVGAERWARSYRTDGREQAASTLAVMNTIPNVSAVLFRRKVLLEALDACAPALETFRLAGDWLVYLEVLSRGDFAFVSRPLNDHRVHEASVTNSALTPLDRVREVGRMQKIARDRLSPSVEVVDAATAYLQKLYDYFGLVVVGPAHVYDHPAFKALAPGR